jgi:hypothetical protein
VTLREDFAALILTHGRPDNVQTLRTLELAGYTGRWYLVVDDEDATRQQYIERFGSDRVITFSKAAIAATMDLADAGGTMSAVVFARNACDGIAADLGLTHYIQLDDDYRSCMYRYSDGVGLRHTNVRRLDDMLTAMIEFFEVSGALTVCLAQGGDYIGGLPGKKYQKCILRKAMNTFICRTGNPIGFPGRINEDVNAYVVHGGRGALLFTITDVCIVQERTQKSAGGMTAAYAGGTYAKSFYPVMMRPDAVTIRLMQVARRPHHHVAWNHAVPKIISARWQRAGEAADLTTGKG